MKMRWQTIASSVSIRTISCHPTTKSSVYSGPPHQSRRIWLAAEAANQKVKKQFFKLILLIVVAGVSNECHWTLLITSQH